MFFQRFPTARHPLPEYDFSHICAKMFSRSHTAQRFFQIFAQCAAESVTAYQLTLRQKKREQNMASIQQSEGEKSKTGAPATEQDAPANKVDQVILLKDFP